MKFYVCLFISLLAVSLCMAETIIVDPNGSADFTTIQEAIDYSWHGGDTIIVHKGTYIESVNLLGKAITLTSSNPLDPNTVQNTIINGGPYIGDSVVFNSGESANTVLNGFLITKGEYYRGLLCQNSSPTITNCTFSGSIGDYESMICDGENSKPTISNCTFSDNWGSFASGMQCRDNSSPTLINCIFKNNFSESVGGAMVCGEKSKPTLINCTFSENSGFWGGGMHIVDSSPTLIGCNFNENTAGLGAGMVIEMSNTVTLVDCKFTGNSFGDHGNCSGAGIYIESSGNISLTNCTFSKNNVGNEDVFDDLGGGGGIFCSASLAITLTNCIFSGNSAYNGGGIYFFETNAISLNNCTFSGNSAGNAGGGLYSYGSWIYPSLSNCILWGNTAGSDGNEIALSNSSTINVSYCNVQGGQAGIYDDGTGTIIWGGSNIDTDPMFVDPNGLDGIIGTEDDNLRLSIGSPCIDAGDNSAVSEPNDLDGNSRIVDGNCDGTATVDMGAYEFNWLYIGDLEGNDCDVDLGDFSILSQNWQRDNPAIDIAPYLAPDGIIDLQELSIIIEHWLESVK